jgi:hypothetical protein
MKNKSLIGFRSWNMLFTFGVAAVGLLFSAFPLMVSASPQTGSPESDASNSSQQAVNHINQAQSALQNGDTAGAQSHLDLAKQALGCNKIIDPNC